MSQENAGEYRILNPDGSDGSGASRIRLMDTWARFLPDTVNMSIGSPSYPINLSLAEAEAEYWRQAADASRAMRERLTQDPDVDTAGSMRPYGSTQGEPESLEQEAAALHMRHPDLPEGYYEAANILSTSGGGEQLGLNAVFHMTETLCPGGVIIAAGPPSYSNYDQISKMHRDGQIETNPERQRSKMRYADIMHQPGYKLTGDSLRAAIENVEGAGEVVQAIVLTDPHIPMGTVMRENLYDIAELLREYPYVPIVLDEAHFQMTFPPEDLGDEFTFQDLHLSLLDVLAKKIQEAQAAQDEPEAQEWREVLDRVILLRSATKGFGDPADRMAMIAAKKEWIDEMKPFTGVMIANPPVGLQRGLAAAHMTATPEEQAAIGDHHGRRVRYMFERLKEMGAAPDDDLSRFYQPEASFCNMACIRELYGLPVSEEVRKALPDAGEFISNDLEAAMHLMMRTENGQARGVAVVPGSAFKMPPDEGWVRLVCSANTEVLQEAAERIEAALEEARAYHREHGAENTRADEWQDRAGAQGTDSAVMRL